MILEQLSRIPIECFEGSIDTDEIIEIKIGHFADGFEMSYSAAYLPPKRMSPLEYLGVGWTTYPARQQPSDLFEDRIEACRQRGRLFQVRSFARARCGAHSLGL